MKSSIPRLAQARKLVISAAAIFLCMVPEIAFTSPGDPDPTFGAGGKVTAVTFDSDHSFQDHRIALSAVVVDWLQQLPDH